MTHATLKTQSLRNLCNRALQVATLLLASAPLALGAPTETPRDDAQLMGQMMVSAAREVPFLGSIVVTAPREAAVANLGAMIVTAPRVTLVAKN